VQHEPPQLVERKGLPLRWDNAPVESFFGTLKQELISRCRFVTRQQAPQQVFAYIEARYNRQRRCSSLGYVSPAALERRALIEAKGLSPVSA
jgi:transposase InsO family protein